MWIVKQKNENKRNLLFLKKTNLQIYSTESQARFADKKVI